MSEYQVIFTQESEEQLLALYNHIAEVSSPAIAQSYTEGIISYCESLYLFPERGNKRDDLIIGLRVTNYRKRTIIAFVVESQAVSILGIWYGGQNYENTLLPAEDI